MVNASEHLLLARVREKQVQMSEHDAQPVVELRGAVRRRRRMMLVVLVVDHVAL